MLILAAAILPVPHLLWYLPVDASLFPLNNSLPIGVVAVCQFCHASGARGSLPRHRSLGIALCFGSRCWLWFAEGGSVTFLARWVITFPAWRWKCVYFTCHG